MRATAAPTVPQEEVSELGAALRHTLDGTWREVRESYRAELDPAFTHRPVGQGLQEARAWTDARLAELAALGYASSGFRRRSEASVTRGAPSSTLSSRPCATCR